MAAGASGSTGSVGEGAYHQFEMMQNSKFPNQNT